MAIVAVAVTATACGVDDHASGERSREVCDSFAAEGDVASALSRISDTDRFTDSGSKPEETLASLRSADGMVTSAEELQGSPLCVLKPAGEDDPLLTIYLREASTVSKADSEKEKTFTLYDTGASAMATDRLASIYFHCRMSNPRKSIIVNGTLERENKVGVPRKETTDKQMLVMNAAARQVTDELGCAGADLAEGTPKATSGVYSRAENR
ncbi:hypothetical protein [Streptomyces sp. NPDC020298]|uniref:hypothetical protein n=1 Tax=unclassified Streptomyces TaxID=2593676 RepID=UPI0033D3AD37